MKIATSEDYLSILKMSEKFINSTGYSELANMDIIGERISNLLSTDKTQGIILITEDGFLAGQAVPFAFGTSFFATEVAWWVEPEGRKKGTGLALLQNFEFWSQNIAKCNGVIMISLDDELGKFYEKNGYKLYERAYMKVFN